MAKWLGVALTSELTGLKQSTLQAYARSRQSSLIRNVDYRVERRLFRNRQRKRLLFSERGVQRLTSRNYRVYSWYNRPLSKDDYPVKNSEDRDKSSVPPSPDDLIFPEHSTPTDKARIARDHVTRCVTYLLEHPCAKDGCGCVCHAMLPGLNAMMELYSHDLQNKSTVIGRQHAAPREETGLLTGRQLGKGYVPRYR